MKMAFRTASPAAHGWHCSFQENASQRPLVSKKRAPTRSVEREMWDLGHDVVVGVDEVGRGAWAGPLMVGAAILPRDRRVNGIRDSKLLTERERERLFARITSWCVAWGVGCRLAGGVRRARHVGGPAPGGAAGDRPTRRGPRRRGRRRQVGLRVARTSATSTRRVRADSRCLSVAAASILAKVVRDREMRVHAEDYPPWSFDTNKGYPCPVHKAALQAYGPSVIHRRTWVFMDHYVPWPGIPRVYRPEQPTLF